MEELYRYQNQLITSTEFLFRRSLIGQIAWDERLIGLLGPRGAGKTTCLLQHLTEQGPPDKTRLYVTLDNLANPYTSLISLAEAFYRRGGKQLMIDEIHKYPGWAAELKNIYDLMPGLRVVFTGSSALKLLSGGTDLSRWAVLYHLSGLSFREFLQIRTGQEFPAYPLQEILKEHEKITFSVSGALRPLQYFPEYLEHGYFPYFLQSVATYPMKLQGVINFIIENEIPAISGLDIRNTQKIRRALQIIAANVPFQPNITKLSEALELNRNTLLQYLNLLEKTGIIISLYAAGSFHGKLTKPGKLLLSHPNLSYALTAGEVNRGSIRESFFASQLIVNHRVELSDKADFLVDDRFTFEIGGKKKSGKQLAGTASGFIVADDIELGYENRIPLWLFGFLY
jgi:predicted AAA+ superfamily ATPase